jgi:hypothetical protein
MNDRSCSKVGCNDTAVSTLTYDYADSLAVLGPLSTVHEPHTYDLCPRHAQRMNAPVGWQVIRYTPLAS